MKNKILLICLLSSHVVFGQFVAGTKMLQGDFNLQASFNGNDKDAANNFKNHYIVANVGAQIAQIESETQHWGFGGNLSFRDDLSQSTNKNNVSISTITNHTTQWAYTLNIFQTRLKKLLPNFYGGFRYSSGLGYSIATTKNTSEQTSLIALPAPQATSLSSKGNSIAANVGITSQFYYFITPKWGLSANIGYANAYFTHDFKAKIWSLNTNSSFNGIGFGLFKILRPSM
jgi:hypothetical protein